MIVRCEALERIEIPASVEKIGRRAFSHCTSLKNVNIANPDADVDSYTFYASSLTSYTQGGAVKRLGGDGTVNTSELTENERQTEISRYQDSYAYQKSLNTNSTFLVEHIEERDYIYTIVPMPSSASRTRFARGLPRMRTRLPPFMTG